MRMEPDLQIYSMLQGAVWRSPRAFNCYCPGRSSYVTLHTMMMQRQGLVELRDVYTIDVQLHLGLCQK